MRLDKRKRKQGKSPSFDDPFTKDLWIIIIIMCVVGIAGIRMGGICMIVGLIIAIAAMVIVILFRNKMKYE